jgi:hypothetical protein
VLRHRAQLHNRGGVEGRDGIEPAEGRSRRPVAGVDENGIGGQRPHAAGPERHLDDLGGCEAAFAENELDVFGLLQLALPPRSEVLHDGLLAPADLCQLHGDRTTAYAVVGGAPGQVGDTGTGDHGLGRRASHVDARAPDVRPFDDRGPPTGGAQVQGQRFARLAGAQNDRVKTLHDNASTTKESGAVATLSACGSLFSFYEVIARDEPRRQVSFPVVRREIDHDALHRGGGVIAALRAASRLLFLGTTTPRPYGSSRTLSGSERNPLAGSLGPCTR